MQTQNTQNTKHVRSLRIGDVVRLPDGQTVCVAEIAHVDEDEFGNASPGGVAVSLRYIGDVEIDALEHWTSGDVVVLAHVVRVYPAPRPRCEWCDVRDDCAAAADQLEDEVYAGTSTRGVRQ